MDRDVRAIVEQLYERVKDAIERHRGALEALAEALLEKETLEGPEALAILQSGGVSLEELPGAGPSIPSPAPPGGPPSGAERLRLGDRRHPVSRSCSLGWSRQHLHEVSHADPSHRSHSGPGTGAGRLQQPSRSRRRLQRSGRRRDRHRAG